MKEIEILIDKDGKVQIEGKNFSGKECDKKMLAFEQELGTVKSRKDLPEYHRTVAATQKVGG